jgi:hypothetical protein
LLDEAVALPKDQPDVVRAEQPGDLFAWLTTKQHMA